MEKILHINDYPIDAGGGAEVVMRRTIELQQQRGLKVATLTSADLIDARRTPLRYLDNRIARRALVQQLQGFHPHVVHLHNYYHLLSPGILDELEQYKQQWPVRIVMTAHDYHLVCPNSGGSAFTWWSGKREMIDPQRVASLRYRLGHSWDHRGCLFSLLKLVQHEWHYRWHRRQQTIDCVICPSRFVQTMLAPTGLTTWHLPHPVPAIARRTGRRPASLHLIFAGRIEPEKGLCELLQALPDDFDAQLTVIGDGSDLQRAKDLCAKRCWCAQVVFPGRLPHAQTLQKIAEAHVLVQPSRVLETYGLTLIEALASGTNVLASDRGAAREIIDDSGVGFLYDVEDAASLVRQLRTVRRCHAEGTLNRFHISAFLEQRSEQVYIDRLLRLYEPDGDTNLVNYRTNDVAA